MFEEISSSSPDNKEKILDSYKPLLERYPSSGAVWSAYAQYLYRMHLVPELERAFSSSVRSILDLRLWKIYLQHVVEVNRDNQDPNTVIQAYEFAVNSVGFDVGAATIWHDYIEILKIIPGFDQNAKTDMIRKVYTRALTIPMENLEVLWQGFDIFEQSINKLSAKKMLADRSAAYMTARSLIKTLQEVSVEGIDRDRLAEPEGEPSNLMDMKSAGWLKWIEWEKSNPLGAEKSIVTARVIYAFKRALMCMRYRPEIWLSMIEFYEEQHHQLVTASSELAIITLLKQAVEYNPLSVSLSIALADRYELDKKIGEAKAIYEGLVTSLENKCALLGDEDPNSIVASTDSSLSYFSGRANQAYASFMAFSRRTDGIPAARAIFTRARKFPWVGPQVYTASALMEFYARKDPAVAAKIFELGMSKFGASSVEYVLEYAKLLLAINDDANLRSLFERSVVQLGKDHNRPIWEMYLDYEAKWSGDLNSLRNLEKRFSESYPTSALQLFSNRNPLEGSEAIRLAKENSNEDSRLLIAKSGGHSLLAVPGTIPDILIVLIGRLPSFKNYDGPKIPVDQLIDHLSKYSASTSPRSPPAGYTGGAQIKRAPFDRFVPSQEIRKDSRPQQHPRDRSDRETTRDHERDHERDRERNRNHYEGSATKKRKPPTSTYDDVFGERRRRKT